VSRVDVAQRSTSRNRRNVHWAKWVQGQRGCPENGNAKSTGWQSDTESCIASSSSAAIVLEPRGATVCSKHYLTLIASYIPECTIFGSGITSFYTAGNGRGVDRCRTMLCIEICQQG